MKDSDLESLAQALMFFDDPEYDVFAWEKATKNERKRYIELARKKKQELE